jgi:hypothetical protein
MRSPAIPIPIPIRIQIQIRSSIVPQFSARTFTPKPWRKSGAHMHPFSPIPIPTNVTIDTAPPALAEDYERHAAAKEARVRALLEAHGLGGLFRGLRRCPVERGWRMQASIRLIAGADGATVTGVDPRTGKHAPLGQVLWTLPEDARPLAVEIGRRMAAEAPEGVVTGWDLRLEYGSGRAHLNLAAVRGAEARLEGLAERLAAEFPALLGVSVPSQGVEQGEAFLRHQLLGKTVLSHHRAFFQTNRWLTPELAAAAREAADGAPSIVDLYCGVGLHSVLAASPQTRVAGIDTNRWAIDSARRNAALHGLENARYEDLPVERLLAPSAREAPMEIPERPAAAIVNPSRFGCAPGVAEAVARWRPGAVCLVSCSIDSHVRDVLAFVDAGYRPRPFESFDMFPFSEFLESVTVFEPAA